MKKTTLILLMLLFAFGLVGCTAPGGETTPAQPESMVSSGLVTLTVIYTNDEHGWMAGEEQGQGAAELAGLWATSYTDSDAVLVLSGGDNWTGPAISTWFEGEGMVEVMNLMGYQAAAVGNHEFDFDLDVMQARLNEAAFPYLGANIRYKSNGDIPIDLGIQPYTIVEAAGLQIGLIGLANFDTPYVTNPQYVSPFEFLPYDEVLREYVPIVWAAGADLIFVPAHICTWELIPLARDVADLGITLFGGGHCHEEDARIIAGSVLLSGGSNLRSYAYATLEIDPTGPAVLNAEYGVLDNKGGTPHPQVAEVVAHWQALTDEELEVVIGYLERDIEKQSAEMEALITEAWLQVYPADVALTNWGGMRADLRAGEVTYASIVSVMPFNNLLVDVELTGEELLRVLADGNPPPVGGVAFKGGEWILDKTGEQIDPEATYQLLTTDFLYAGGSDYTMLARYDPQAYDTTINWRQPVIDWVLAQNSSPNAPLDDAVNDLVDK